MNHSPRLPHRGNIHRFAIAFCILAVSVTLLVLVARAFADWGSDFNVTTRLTLTPSDKIKVKKTLSMKIVGSPHNTGSAHEEEDLGHNWHDFSLGFEIKSSKDGEYTPAIEGSDYKWVTHLPTGKQDSSTATASIKVLSAGYWKITGSASATYWSSPDGKEDDATDSTSDSDSGDDQITVYKFDITYTGPVAGESADNGTVVTDKTTKVHAGWPIDVSTELAPSDFSSSYSWSIPGSGAGNGDKAIGGYTATTNSASVTPLDTSTNAPSLATYYYAASGSRTVHVNVNTTQGGILTAKTTFDVMKPSITVTTTTSSVILNQNDPACGISLSFGQFPQTVGITFNATAVPAGFSGNLQWVQIYHALDLTRGTQSGTGHTYVGEGLDHSLPYSTGSSTDDSPCQPLRPAYDTCSVDDSATMWLEYTPKASGSIPVPVQSVRWNWGASAKRVNGSWTLDGTPYWSHNPSGTTTNKYPVWSQNITAVKWTPPLSQP